MKKISIFLTALLLSVGVNGREWITANSLKQVSEHTLKHYVLLDNDIQKCYFPELWQNPNKATDILNQWSEKEPARFSLYSRIYYRLPYDKLPEDILRDMSEGDLHSEYQNTQLDKVRQKYKGKTTVKNKQDCKRIGEYIQHLLST